MARFDRFRMSAFRIGFPQAFDLKQGFQLAEASG
jgi:hypothetical protein